MHLKSYYAATVESAIQRARQELGEEALLMNSRPATGQARNLGAYEVVFALPEAGQRPSPAPVGAVAGENHQAADSGRERVFADLRALRRELETMRAAVARSGALSISGHALLREPELAGMYWALLENDIPSETALELVSTVAAQPVRNAAGRLIPSRLQVALGEQMERRVAVSAELGLPRKIRGGPKIVAFVGPPGAGKTTTLVKVAVAHGMRSRRPVQFLSVDSLRVGGSEQLRTYATILGVGFQACDNLRTIHQSLEEHRHKDWVFLDTPGFSPRDHESSADLADFLARNVEIDVHLVLSASMKTADLCVAAERFAAFRPNKIVFTHLDETESFGALFTLPLKTGKPVSFLCGGQQIPEDIETAGVERILSLVLERVWIRLPQTTFQVAQAGRAAAGL